jgi:hypothetical protein
MHIQKTNVQSQSRTDQRKEKIINVYRLLGSVGVLPLGAIVQ